MNRIISRTILAQFGLVFQTEVGQSFDMELDASDDEPLADFVFRFISSSTGGGQQVALLFTGHRLLALNLQRQTLVTRVAQTKEELFGY